MQKPYAALTQDGNVQPEDAWKTLFARAGGLLDGVAATVGQPIAWSFGGGTVLMLRLHHRRSKDIDIFLPDAQLLGLFNPRLSDRALALTSDYDEGASHVKLFFPEGEIDFVVAEPLTSDPFEEATVLGRKVLLERSAEIIAKKFWHRGHLGSARDLFDLAAVFMGEPQAIAVARPMLKRHAAAFLVQLGARRDVLFAEFEAIDRLDFALGFDDCSAIAHEILGPLAAQNP